MFGRGGKLSLISESVAEIRINIHHAGEKPNNTTYAWSLGPYIRQPFAKSLRGRIQAPTPGMKSWFYSDLLTRLSF
jgi:hypothetical protein